MVATGLHRGADVVTVDTVGLFGLADVPADQPAGAPVTSGDAVDPTRAGPPDRGRPVPAAADRVGPLGGAVGPLPTVTEAVPLERDAVPDAEDLDC